VVFLTGKMGWQWEISVPERFTGLRQRLAGGFGCCTDASNRCQGAAVNAWGPAGIDWAGQQSPGCFGGLPGFHPPSPWPGADCTGAGGNGWKFSGGGAMGNQFCWRPLIDGWGARTHVWVGSITVAVRALVLWEDVGQAALHSEHDVLEVA